MDFEYLITHIHIYIYLATKMSKVLESEFKIMSEFGLKFKLTVLWTTTECQNEFIIDSNSSFEI